jgi:hypothetical protein
MTTHNETFPEHRPLGASSAERWMNCPGSNVMLKTLNLQESDDQDWRIEGVAAHEAAAYCLQEDIDAYEVVGQTFNGFKIDADTAVAIQEYLDECARVVADMREQLKTLGLEDDVQTFIEVRVSGDFHDQFYGTADFVAVSETLGCLYVIDYKHGEGIAVDATNNPQLKYYGLGMSLKYPRATGVVLVIVQPRAFHEEGPIREWLTTSTDLEQWKDEDLIPAMRRAEFDTSLSPGDWCRFCPAKLACPLLTGLFGVAATADQQAVVQFSDQKLELNYNMVGAVKHYITALGREMQSRMERGTEMSDHKLVYKRANRVWRAGAKEAFVKEFGADKVLTPAQIKSPSDMEKISSASKKLVKEYAFTPTTGLTVAHNSAKKAAVKVQTVSETFAQAIETETGKDK